MCNKIYMKYIDTCNTVGDRKGLHCDIGYIISNRKQSSNFLRNARRIGMLLVSKMAPFRDYQVAIFDPEHQPPYRTREIKLIPPQRVFSHHRSRNLLCSRADPSSTSSLVERTSCTMHNCGATPHQTTGRVATRRYTSIDGV